MAWKESHAQPKVMMVFWVVVGLSLLALLLAGWWAHAQIYRAGFEAGRRQMWSQLPQDWRDEMDDMVDWYPYRNDEGRDEKWYSIAGS